MNDIKNLAEFADKKFGQNFLKNSAIVQQIIQAMPNDRLPVAEIGPGLGDLTKELINVRSVTAFEVDKRLCEHLRKSFDEPIRQKALTIQCGDVLEHWGQNQSLLDKPYHLVANLPYYIATNIILRALKDSHCQSILVMVQKEVAEKFSAQSGERVFSALSVLTQRVGYGELLFDVGAENFVPPPKVTSATLLIKKQRSEDDPEFEDFLKVAFKQPRKKLSKNLAVRFEKDKIEALFLQLDIESNIRPHEATTDIYCHLYNELTKDNVNGREINISRRNKSRNAQK
ncbi:MAG: 16S rRNA (adenine(1518)-N(6)/adenine(1519)-N(6))-dimethyltransferase RsmA [Campylobacterales bacterium]|nr:16S rRNA (adenine(1518)-N(6)/adenine(1519)-N(6))-dimethyltransferase RsmA [Campylobacterales bacterium]